MMAFLLSVIWLFHAEISAPPPYVPPGANPSLQRIRTMYERSVESKDSCLQLIRTLDPYDVSDAPLLAGYKAAAFMIMARHVLNPISKFTWFQRGRSLLEKAITAAPSNIELRYLRYSIQTNCPGFLHYRGHIAEDRKLLQGFLDTAADSPLSQMITRILDTPAS